MNLSDVMTNQETYKLIAEVVGYVSAVGWQSAMAIDNGRPMKEFLSWYRDKIQADMARSIANGDEESFAKAMRHIVQTRLELSEVGMTDEWLNTHLPLPLN